MVEKELVRDSNSLRDNFRTLINTKDIIRTVGILLNSDLVFVYDGNCEGGNLINKRIDFLEKQIKETMYKIETVVKENEFLSRNFNLLITVEGINFNVAWRILAEFNYETINDITLKSLVAHAGLSPRENSSGEKYGKVSISKIGKSDLRKIMYMPALSCIRHDNYFASFYLHLLEQRKPKKVAIVAVMRKMILTAMGVLKNQEPFDPEWSKKVQTKYQEKLMAV